MARQLYGTDLGSRSISNIIVMSKQGTAAAGPTSTKETDLSIADATRLFNAPPECGEALAVIGKVGSEFNM